MDETKAYFKTLWRSMEPECNLKNLKEILKFLQSSAEEVCFLNVQEKYLPFHYMMVLNNNFLSTTFLTDECKVLANEILRTLEVNKNSFTLEVTFGREIAGIPIIFKKVYIKPFQEYSTDAHRSTISKVFKNDWVQTTLNYIKSSELILNYPDMVHREAQYLYRGILKLNEEELGPDSVWAPVWEALNIFKLRYEYILSLHSTTSDQLKCIQFQKVTLQRKNCPNEDQILIKPLDITAQKKESIDNINNNCKNNVLSDLGANNKVKVQVINHNELIKTLIEMNVSHSGSIVYTLKGYAPDIDVAPTMNIAPTNNENVTEISLVNKAIVHDSNLVTVDNPKSKVSLEVQDEIIIKNTQNSILNVSPRSKDDEGFSEKDNPDNPINNENETIYKEITEHTKNNKLYDANNDSVDAEVVIKSRHCSKNENALEDTTLTVVTSPMKNEVECKKSQLTESNMDNAQMDDVILIDDENSSIIEISDSEIDESEKVTKCDDSAAASENPFFQQFTKLQRTNRPLLLKEEDFITAETSNDYVNTNMMKSIISKYESYKPNNCGLIKKVFLKKPVKALPSTKAQRRNETKIRQKRRLVSSVPVKFILTSFKAILDFINDDLRASMEMVSLNMQELNLLRKLHSFAPKIIHFEKIFDKTCVSLVVELFDTLRNIRNYSLQIKWIKPKDMPKRTVALIFTKKPFRKTINNSISTQNKKNIVKGKDFEEPRNPKSILDMSPEWLKSSRSSSVSSAQTKLSSTTRSSELLRTKSFDSDDELNDKPSRTQSKKASGNPAVEMKAKLLEGLAVPLESDKAMRMMRLMGWNGGALGPRGEGLIEPIQPQLNVRKGVGLGHKMLKSKKNINKNKLKDKIANVKIVSDQETIQFDKADSNEIYTDNSVRIIDNKNNDNVVTNEDMSDKLNTLENKEKTNFTKTKSLQVNVHYGEVNDDNVRPNKVVSNSSDDADAWTMKSVTETNSKEQIASGSWLTNENLSQKIKDRSAQTASNSNVGTMKTKIDNTNSNDKDKINQKNSRLSADTFIHRNIETVSSNQEKLIKSLKDLNIKGPEQYKVDDEKLHPYNTESKARFLSDQMQFLVNLLDLLQSHEKICTVVSYWAKPSVPCIQYIDSIIWSLSHRVEISPTLPRERLLIEACAREMEAHTLLLLSYRFKKKSLILVKNIRLSNFDPSLTDLPCTLDVNFSTTHLVKNCSFFKDVCEQAYSIMRSKMFTNRIVLEFVKSGDDARVYEYERTSSEVRKYMASLASLLNRQMDQYHMGLGITEHPIFRETLDAMKNFCIIFRFDDPHAYFTKMQLVKVDLTKKCRICQIAYKTSNPSSSIEIANSYETENDKADDSDDIDLYPNRINVSKNYAIYRSDRPIDENNSNTSKLNNEKISNDRDFTNVKVGEEYLIGEDWLDSDVNDEKDTKAECNNKLDLETDEVYENVQHAIHREMTVDGKNDTVKNVREVNASDEEISSDFHNWPKRIRKNYTNYKNVTNDNIELQATKIYENENIRKRKVVSIAQKVVEKSAEDLTKLDKTLTVELDNLQKTAELNTDDNDTGLTENKKYGNINHDKKKEINDTDDTNYIGRESHEIAQDAIRESIEQTSRKIKSVMEINLKNWPKKVLIVHYNQPECKIDEDAVKSLQTIIYEAANKGDYLPRIKCNGLKEDGVVYTCYDYDSYIWLYRQLEWYSLLDYEDGLDTTHVIEMKITSFINIDINVIFKNIETFYDDIKTNSWKVINIKVLPSYYVFRIEIDEFSLNSITNENFSLFVGIDKVDISVIYD